MKEPGSVRGWARRLVVVAASILSIATTPARWSISAAAPPTLAAGGTRLVVEASHPPRVTYGVEGDVRTALEEHGATKWPGVGTFVLPGAARDVKVAVDGYDCEGGAGLCSSCRPPASAYVRIKRVDPVPTWQLTATKPLKLHLDSGPEGPVFDVKIDSSLPAHLRVVATTPDAPGKGWTSPDIDRGVMQFTFGWTRSEGALAPRDIDVTLEATIFGACPDGAPCEAPSREHVRIVSAEPREHR